MSVNTLIESTWDFLGVRLLTRSVLLSLERAVRLRSLSDAIEPFRTRCNVLSGDVRIVDDVLQINCASSKQSERDLPSCSLVTGRVSSTDRRVRRGTYEGDDSFNLNIEQMKRSRKPVDFIPMSQGTGIDATGDLFHVHFFVDGIS